MKWLCLGGCLLLQSCAIVPPKCSFWAPIIGVQSLFESDINKAIKNSSLGTRCEMRFQ